MALIDHFAPDAGLDTGLGENGFERITIHSFVSMFAATKKGAIGGSAAARRARIISEFNLQAADEAELDLIVNALTPITNEGEIAQFLFYLEKALSGYEGGHLSKAETAALAGV